MSTDDYLQMYCIFSREALAAINGIRGKMATQAGHAYLHAWWNSPDEIAQLYKNSGFAKKITLVVPTTQDLIQLHAAYKGRCGTSLVTDRGLTVFKEPTTTCLGIGPILKSKVGDDLNSLKLLV